MMASLQHSFCIIFLLPWLLLRLHLVIAQELPLSEIRLRAGVLHAPPFAFVERDDTGTGNHQFSGFHIDLIERLKLFALEMDGINLLVDLEPGPLHYNEGIDVIANDCNTTRNPAACSHFDLILGDFYSTSERYMRVDFTPPWLHTAVSTVKYIEKEDPYDITTLKEAESSKASICVPKETYIVPLVWEEFPKAVIIKCDGSGDECITLLKHGNCALFADDALLLHYRASKDSTLQVTREKIRSQYMVWPMEQSMNLSTSTLMKKWMYAASNDGTLDKLYSRYFQKELCPIGTAGENCNLPCDPDHGAADDRGRCVCISPKWHGDDCSIEVLENYNLLPSNLVKTCYVLVGITFVVVLCCGAWVIYNRKRAQVKVAQPSFLLLILLGCVISTSTIIALAQEDEGHGPVNACMAIPWLYSVGFSITFGSLFAKIRRVYKLMESAAEMRRVTVSVSENLISVGLVLVMDVLVLVIWTAIDPLEWKRTTTIADQFGEPLESVGSCTSDHWMVFTAVIATFHLLLICVACYMCFLARSIPERFSNCRYISIAMFSNLQIMICAVPVLIILGADPESSFFVRSIAVWINDFVVIGLIFGNLIYQVHKFDKENKISRISSQLSIRTDIRNYAKQMHKRTKESSLDCDLDDTMLSSSRARFSREPEGLPVGSIRIAGCGGGGGGTGAHGEQQHQDTSLRSNWLGEMMRSAEQQKSQYFDSEVTLSPDRGLTSLEEGRAIDHALCSESSSLSSFSSDPTPSTNSSIDQKQHDGGPKTTPSSQTQDLSSSNHDTPEMIEFEKTLSYEEEDSLSHIQAGNAQRSNDDCDDRDAEESIGDNCHNHQR